MSNENKSANLSTNPELDELLDNALADFDKLSQPIVKKEDCSVASSSETDKKLTEEFPIDESWTQDFIKQTAEQFEHNLQGLVQNGDDFEESLQKMAHTVASAISSGSADDSGEGTEFQAAMAQALKDISTTSENFQNAASGITEAELATMLGATSLDESGGDIFSFMQKTVQLLLSKEILYPPLKEMVEKYPAWLNEKKESLSNSEFQRFNEQLDLMQKVCTELELENDSDTEDMKKKRFDKVLGLIQDMHSCGQPPEELVGDQAGLFQVDNEGNPVFPPGVDPQNCNIM